MGGNDLNVDNNWELMSLYGSYTSSADVANRYVEINMGDIKNQVIVGLKSSVIVANKIYNLTIMKAVASSGLDCYPATDGSLNLFLGDKAWILSGDDHIKVTVSGGNANDSLVMTWHFRWLNWELGLDLDPLYNGKSVVPVEQKKWCVW